VKRCDILTVKCAHCTYCLNVIAVMCVCVCFFVCSETVQYSSRSASRSVQFAVLFHLYSANVKWKGCLEYTAQDGIAQSL